MTGLSHPPVRAQEVTTKAPPVALPEAPQTTQYPVAQVVPDSTPTSLAVIESDDPQTKVGSLYTLDKNVVIEYRGYRVEADHVEYDSDSGDMTATGHMRATGGANHEEITASHGTVNMKTQTGRFYDVKGSVGLKTMGHKTVYVSGNPFLFNGRMVVKTGPQNYTIYDGSVTSCQLPHPDWLLSAARFDVDGTKAKASNTVFRLLNIPLLYLPYVTHPVDAEERQTGLLIPIIGQSSTKGLVLGEQLYWSINRSTDLTLGAEYFSLRGWSQLVSFRYRGRGDDFVQARYTGLLDRQNGPLGTAAANQGGEDLLFVGRHDFSEQTRIAANVEYLSSYVYREAFTENFNQAVSSDILSTAYGVHSWNGYSASVEADRYQGLKSVPLAATATAPAQAGQEVRIFHVPSLDLTSTDHELGHTHLLWSLDSSAGGLKRVQPGFATGGVTERLDLHPQIAYPLSGGGWHLLPSVGVRETLYSRQRVTPYVGILPVELKEGLGRSDVEVQVEARAPVVERTFRGKAVERWLHSDVKHTIEPSVTYRYVSGINNFLNILRFDERDVASNTNEIRYGVTQRLFVRPSKGKPCGAVAVDLDAPQADDDGGNAPPPQTRCTTREWISWRVEQKYFLDDSFGGAVINGRRNIFDTTLALSGVAFLTERRDISPVISRLRVRTSDKVDVEWDFDLDTGAKKFTSNNLLIDVHKGNVFGGLSYARLNAPGRFFTQGTPSATSNFDQMRILMGYGTPAKRGLSVAANAGLDLNLTTIQYAALQTSYNWNCCGFSVEYRKCELGAVRNENAYRFNFTLANIGTAGNLRRAERLF